MFDNDYRITALPLSLKWARNRLEQFLASCGLRLDTVDYYAIVTAGDSEEILGGAGIEGNVVKCVAVTDALRGTGMMQRLISHIINHAASQGVTGVKVYTKPENEDIFSSLGFCKLATSPKAILMENGMQGLNDYCRYLRSLHHPGYNGLIVMNANPFTQGHLALVEHASKQVDTLYVVVVKEDKSLFSYEERLAMVSAGCAGFDNVVVCEGSDYAISSATFPTYFLKEVSDATDTQITLDLDLCAQHIAPAVGTKVRFVGSEPTDAVTARYVALMQELLPPIGVRGEVM
ncbi:MAG: [Muribaculaceae bacterium]|nr:[citrate (pro-3S)-lyase] ligase [Muribaculaceae bacterium]